MRLYELFNQVNKSELLDNILKIYPDSDYDSYSYAFDNIINIILANTVDMTSDLQVLVYKVESLSYDGESYISDDVNGYSETEQEVYGLDLVNWSSWLGMSIIEKSYNYYGILDFLTHVMYEMTFSGFSSDAIDDFANKIHTIVEEIKSGEAKTYTHEEMHEAVFSKLDLEEFKSSVTNEDYAALAKRNAELFTQFV